MAGGTYPVLWGGGGRGGSSKPPEPPLPQPTGLIASQCTAVNNHSLSLIASQHLHTCFCVIVQNNSDTPVCTANVTLHLCTFNPLSSLLLLSWKQGLNLLIPILNEIKYVQSLKEQAIEIPSQSAITEGVLQQQ